MTFSHGPIVTHSLVDILTRLRRSFRVHAALVAPHGDPSGIWRLVVVLDDPRGSHRVRVRQFRFGPVIKHEHARASITMAQLICPYLRFLAPTSHV